MRDDFEDYEDAGVLSDPDFGPEVEASIHRALYGLLQALMPLPAMYRAQARRIDELEDAVDRMQETIDAQQRSSGGAVDEPGWWLELNGLLARNADQLGRMSRSGVLRQIGARAGREAMRFAAAYGLESLMDGLGSSWGEEHVAVLAELRGHDAAASVPELSDRGEPMVGDGLHTPVPEAQVEWEPDSGPSDS